MICARFKLPTGTDLATRFICSHFKPHDHLIYQFLELCGIFNLPRWIQTCVAEHEHPAGSILKRELGELMQRIRCPPGSPTACAGQDKALHTVRTAQCQFLRHHAPKGHAHNEATIPPDHAQQTDGIRSIIRHGVRNIWSGGLTKTPLIIGKYLELLGKWGLEDVG